MGEAVAGTRPATHSSPMCDRSNRPARGARRGAPRGCPVLDGHLPAAEVDEPGAQRPMRRDERRLPQRWLGSVHAPSARGRARATTRRSVGKLISDSASATVTQRTSSNSWSWRRGRRRWPPSGSSGRSCGCARPSGRSSTRSRRRGRGCAPPGRSPPSTSRRAVCSSVSSPSGVPLGSDQVTPIAVPTPAPEQELVDPDPPAAGRCHRRRSRRARRHSGVPARSTSPWGRCAVARSGADRARGAARSMRTTPPGQGGRCPDVERGARCAPGRGAQRRGPG